MLFFAFMQWQTLFIFWMQSLSVTVIVYDCIFIFVFKTCLFYKTNHFYPEKFKYIFKAFIILNLLLAAFILKIKVYRFIMINFSVYLNYVLCKLFL